MIHVEETMIINRPVDEVFEFAVNPESTPKWQSMLQSAALLTDGPIGVGSKLHHVRTYYGGMRFESTPEIIEFERNRRYRARDDADGPFAVIGGIALEPQDGSTKLTYDFTLKPQGKFRFKPLGWIVGTLWIREAKRDFRNLKAMLEAHPASVTR